MIAALGLGKDADWDEIERTAAKQTEEIQLLGHSPFTAWDMETITELLDGLGISGARLQYVLGSMDPIAALKIWR